MEMSKRQVAYSISKEESERIQILKLWFTVMVLFIHSYSENVNYIGENIVLQVPMWLYWMKYIISQVIARCAVPGFFFISAMLLYKKDFTWKSNMKKKVRSLLIPYLIFNTFWIIFYFIAHQIPAVSVYFSSSEDIISNWGGGTVSECISGD